ncbi:MAG TPA: hypothetical protein VIH72_01310 [Candidatus Acidoferrales bacterium]|jgi:hypothetical protein
MKASRTCFLLVFGAFFIFCAQVSCACSCSGVAPGTCQDFKKTGSSFVGTVTAIDNPADERRGADQSGESRYRFRVDENINGVDAKEVDVYSGRGGGDCSFHFELGKSYFVQPGTGDGRLFATICSQTQLAEGAEPMLSELRARRDGKKFASLYGVLRKTQQPYVTTQDDFDRPLPGVIVELRGDSHTLSVRTDDAGVFRFYEVPADTYHFAAALPDNLVIAQTILSDPPPPITIPDHACYQADIEVLPTSRIRGKVIGPDGQPLRYADVELFKHDGYTESGMGWWEFQGDQKAYFEFDHVTPGTYVIVFHNSNRSDPDIPFPRTFYPGTPDRQTALPIIVGDGQQILDADIRVNGGSPTRIITVHVKWTEDPTPDDVYVTVHASVGDSPLPSKRSPGVFEVSVFRDAHYTIFAEQFCGHRQEGNMFIPIGSRETDRVEIDGSDMKTTSLTLSLKDRTCKPPHLPPPPH